MSLFERVKAILLTPKTEWPVIEREQTDTIDLFKNYVAILAAIPAIAGFIGFSLIGVGQIRVPIFIGLVNALVGYVLTFVVVYVVALIVDALADTFEGERDFANALKVTAYSYTPAWLAGIFLMIPGLRLLTVLGLYGFYLLWTGLPVLMRSPPERSLGYAVTIVACAFVIYVVISLIQSMLLT